MNSRRWKSIIGNNFDQVSENEIDKDPYLERVYLTGQASNFVNDPLTNISS